MSLLKDKLKLKGGSIRKQIEAEKEKKGGKKDPRFLNYYDLKDDERMKVLIIPDKNGRLWSSFEQHSIQGVAAGKVRCLRDFSEECPSCQRAFDGIAAAKEMGDIKQKGSDAEKAKDEARRWFPNTRTIVSVIVLEAPMAISETPDHNQVKLFALPQKVKEMIENNIIEGQLEEDELTSVPLIIKKTKNSGGRPSYENSFFARSPVTDEELEFFEDQVVEPFDYDDETITLPASTAEEIEAWMEKAERMAQEAEDKKNKKLTGHSASEKKSTAERLSARRAAPKEEAESQGEPASEPVVEETPEEAPAPVEDTAPVAKSPLAAKLAKLKK